MGRKILASLVLIVAVLAFDFGAQAGAAKQTEATITCSSPGTTTIDWLPGQTTFAIDFYVASGTGYWHIDGIMKGGGKYTMQTPPSSVRFEADVSGQLLSGGC